MALSFHHFHLTAIHLKQDYQQFIFENNEIVQFTVESSKKTSVQAEIALCEKLTKKLAINLMHTKF